MIFAIISAALIAATAQYRLIVYDDGTVRTQKVHRAAGATNSVRRASASASTNNVTRVHYGLIARKPDVQLCEECFAKVHGAILSRTVDDKMNRVIDIYEDGAEYTNSLKRTRKPASGKSKPRTSETNKPELPTSKLPPELKRAREKYNAERNGINIRVVVPEPIKKEEE